ncbi:hypothetical protein COOONC_03216 [Cooperia oncophora]
MPRKKPFHPTDVIDLESSARCSAQNSALCIHVRRTDFVQLNVSTNINETLRATNKIATRFNISRFAVFGDDQIFMHTLARKIELEGHWKENSTLVSKFDEAMDLYLASRLCRSFLITSVTSTFGWWLAFFIPDQNAVFYVSDERGQPGKKPSKELFM